MRNNQSNADPSYTRVHRRGFLAGGAGLGATLFAGCAGTDDGIFESSANGDDGDTSSTGQFRLLVSDRPSAIGDFAELNVTFEKARVFGGSGDIEESIDDSDNTSVENNTTSNTSTTDNASVEEHDNTSVENNTSTDDGTLDDVDDHDQQGFTEIDLSGQQADLTQLIGERATEVADIPLAPGEYSTVQLFVADVEGIASDEYDPDDGPGRPDDAGRGQDETDDSELEGDADNGDDTADDEIILPVKLPSERLQIVRPFEIVAGEGVEFVFDINVIRRGDGEYILQPVIGESGVVGEDVEAVIIDDADNETTASADD